MTRLTLYRHFAGRDELFAACMSHWRAAHPPPDPGGVGRSPLVRGSPPSCGRRAVHVVRRKPRPTSTRSTATRRSPRRPPIARVGENIERMADAILASSARPRAATASAPPSATCSASGRGDHWRSRRAAPMPRRWSWPSALSSRPRRVPSGQRLTSFGGPTTSSRMRRSRMWEPFLRLALLAAASRCSST